MQVVTVSLMVVTAVDKTKTSSTVKFYFCKRKSGIEAYEI
jgi:hypothetical protein